MLEPVTDPSDGGLPKRAGGKAGSQLSAKEDFYIAQNFAMDPQIGVLH